MNPVLVSNYLLRAIIYYNSRNLFWRKLRARVAVASRFAPALLAIVHVVLMRSQQQMIWINTQRDITNVPHM